MTDPTLVGAILARATRTVHSISYAYLLGATATLILIVLIIGYLWSRRA